MISASISGPHFSRAGLRGRPLRLVSSVGWDFGSQAQSTTKYKNLCWIEAKYWGLESSDVFRLKERPTDRRLVEREHAAYKSVFPDLADLLKNEV